ncbi:MAG: helix-turn-helix domain-containing protein [Candidatus Saccharimonadaceae bacterium]
MSSNIQVKRVCEFCGNVFIAKTTVTRFCSHTCNSRHGKQVARELKIQAAEQTERPKIIVSATETVVSEFLTVRGASKLLNISTRGVYHMILSGRIKAIRLTERKTLVKRADIDQMIVLAEFQPPVLKERKKNPHSKYCYSMAEAQQALNLSEKTVYELLKRNNIPKYQEGKYSYVLKSDVNKFSNQND